VLFRVLGPVEVRGVAVAPRKQRLLLAALLARRGGWVSTGRLVDVLWEDDPPRSAMANMQTYVWELRRRLPRTRLGRPRVTRDREGYRLLLDEGELDAASFEELAARGRRALAAGDTGRGAGLLSDALDLWRGEPFEDVAAAAPDVVAQLREQRQLAGENLLDARLRLGEHREAIDELYRLTAADPVRERPWMLLMLALYRCGRRAEALHTYHRLYRLLDGEYGIEPGAPVRDLHGLILADDPALLPADNRYTASPA
jgi:SARP family transcriptional regulator, regulator of embCAB operon